MSCDLAQEKSSYVDILLFEKIRSTSSEFLAARSWTLVLVRKKGS